MTLWGTNSFILGETEVVIVDPGPSDPSHLEALLRAVAGRPVRAILVTHSHLDHSALCLNLRSATGAPVMAFGPSGSGRREHMQALADHGLSGGGEGVDPSFQPDARIGDGERIRIDGEDIEAIWTPGHMSNHLSFAWQNAVLCGDVVMGWSSTLISPPDGDLTEFSASCARLKARSEPVFHPAHGATIFDPIKRIDDLVAHRRTREMQICHALRDHGPQTAQEVMARVYTDTPQHLRPAATRNVLAHLIDLVQRGDAHAAPKLSTDAWFVLADS